jgi:hypothetical protein
MASIEDRLELAQWAAAHTTRSILSPTEDTVMCMPPYMPLMTCPYDMGTLL